MDFFGSKSLRGSGLAVPPIRFLTAFGSPWNTFLGYYIDTFPNSSRDVKKKRQGVIWGKDVKHFDGKVHMLQQVADAVELHTTVTENIFSHGNIRWHGHQSPASWRQLLFESKFIIGLGHPLLGPSAIDAIAAGCMYINPVYASPVRDIFKSQHPFAVQNIGAPYVCSYSIGDIHSLMNCVNLALETNLKPIIPKDFTEMEYINRVKKIFNL